MPILASRGAGSAKGFGFTAGGSPYIVATGGTESECGDYKIHTFTGPGSFVVSNAGSPLNNTVDYLVVAGGGSGSSPGPSSPSPAAGGAGGFRFYANTTNNPQSGPGAPRNNYPSGTAVPVSATTYPITVGGGGAAVTCSVGVDGSPSTFSTIISTGGGGAGNQNFPTPAFPNAAQGHPGGSGGGAAYPNSAAGAGNTPPTSPPQGSDGGSSLGDTCSSSGAGGGGAMVAANPTNVGGNPRGSAGGAGAGITGFGTSGEPSGGQYYFAGGGGSKGYGAPTNVGGIGGGGPSAPSPNSPSDSGGNGTTNTGGGGGGADNSTGGASKRGGDGGSGIIVIRYKFQ
jgi:hypothetical protein